MSLRPVARADVPRLAALHAASFEVPWTADAIAATLDGAGVLGFAAEDGPELSGFLIVRVAAGEAEVLTLAVDPARRRAGLGAQLTAAGIEAARAAAADAVFLEVAADNEAALALYQGLGFERMGMRKGYYARPDGRRVDALTLRLDLTA